MDDIKSHINSFLSLKEENDKLRANIQQILFDDLAEFLNHENESCGNDARVWPFRLVKLVKSAYDNHIFSNNLLSRHVLSNAIDVVSWAIPLKKRRIFKDKIMRINHYLHIDDNEIKSIA